MRGSGLITLVMLALSSLFVACGDDTTPNFVVTPPGTDTGNNGETTDPGEDNNGQNPGDQGGQEQPEATLCNEEDLGQKPMIIAYYTENSSAIPDPACLTHINYAHGRFVDKETGDGGIWIEQPEKLQKVVELKKVKPTLKVLLMIGGWGDKADGFSEMARDARKRALFCQSCAEHIRNYNLDGIDIDWEYPTAGPSENGKHPDDTKNFNLVLKELREAIGVPVASLRFRHLHQVLIQTS